MDVPPDGSLEILDHDATRHIPDGQTITVDGTAGRVLFQAKFR